MVPGFETRLVRMAHNSSLSDAQRIADLEKQLRALEEKNGALQAQLRSLRAKLVPPSALSAEERAVLVFCVNAKRPVGSLDLLEQLGVSELRIHFLTENLMRMGALEKTAASNDPEPTYAITALGLTLLDLPAETETQT